MNATTDPERWPALPYEAWKDTCSTLHLWTQVVGKVLVSQTPWLNHSWHVPLHLTARGLTTPPIFRDGRVFDIAFDFIDQQLVIRTDAGSSRRLTLQPRTVAAFYSEVMEALRELGLPLRIDRVPNELSDPVPFDRDTLDRAYDAEFAQRFWRVLAQAARVLYRFRTSFLGKSSPVLFFWGSFDLAVPRFSGRPAPPHPGGVPHLPDAVAREAYSHEVSSAGFWPGGNGIEYAAFYSYTYPEPAGFRTTVVRPAAAFFNQQLGEFLLPYDAVRTASDPDATLLEFLQSTYEAAAEAARWDRAALECPLGLARIPRSLG